MNLGDRWNQVLIKFRLAVAALLSRLSFRVRLIIGFIILILSSASATIFIGNKVFGSEVDALAREQITLYNTLTEQQINLCGQKMLLLARSIAANAQDKSATEIFLEAQESFPLDFMIITDGEKNESVVRPPEENTGDGLIYTEAPAPAGTENRSSSSIFRLLKNVAEGRRNNIAGLLSIDRPELEAIGLSVDQQNSLAVVAAVGKPERSVVVGWLFDGKEGFLRDIAAMIDSQGKRDVEVTIFQSDSVIATTFGRDAPKMMLDREAVQSIYSGGRNFIGKITIGSLTYYTNYTNLGDINGKIIGAIGAGTNEEFYNKIITKTRTLFSSLIAGGMIFGFIMTFLFARLLMKPLTDLAEGMSRVAEGDFEYKVRLSSKDELGTLARAFNKMVGAVKESNYRLREATENKLSHVEKQISIGRLAAGVAHEINNPLTSILTLSTLLLRNEPNDSGKREDLEIIVDESTRCREIVRSLLDFARESQANKAVFDVNEVLQHTLALTQTYDAMDRVELVISLSENSLPVFGDPSMLQQVFTNLLLNAAEAVSAKGRITIETEADGDGKMAEIRISDNGEGISEKHLDRIFEPFFTTKGSKKGTGLGLSVTLGIIRKHDGVIDVFSHEGRGTTITVLLPLVADMPQLKEEAE